MEISCQNPTCLDCNRIDSNNLVKNGKDKQQQQRYLCKTCGKTFSLSNTSKPNKRESWQVKPGTREQKSQRGVGELYDQVKKQVNIAITPTAKAGLDQLGRSFSISRSEVVERFGRTAEYLATVAEVEAILSESFTSNQLSAEPVAYSTQDLYTSDVNTISQATLPEEQAVAASRTPHQLAEAAKIFLNSQPSITPNIVRLISMMAEAFCRAPSLKLTKIN
jgi:hypothetical protein